MTKGETNPYASQPPRAFWSRAVAQCNPLELADVYRPRFSFSDDTIGAAGSCFAQHIGRAFRERGFDFLDVEPAPPELPSGKHAAYGYGIYSARYGNVYSARQLLQLFQRAHGEFKPKDEAWNTGGRWHDPFRPTIEPDGFSSREEMLAIRESHLAAVRKLFASVDTFVFTFGLTEGWVSKEDGAAFPMCPGTAAGTFDAAKYEFRNFNYGEILADMRAFMERMTAINRSIKFLLTVSPVPLTATATQDHVMVATSYSKSTLRAVAGDLYSLYDSVEYFPSYELVAATPMKAMFFAPNMREVSMAGVRTVMGHFFSQHKAPQQAPPVADGVQPSPHLHAATTASAEADHFDVCDERLLERWGPR